MPQINFFISQFQLLNTKHLFYLHMRVSTLLVSNYIFKTSFLTFPKQIPYLEGRHIGNSILQKASNCKYNEDKVVTKFLAREFKPRWNDGYHGTQTNVINGIRNHVTSSITINGYKRRTRLIVSLYSNLECL